MGTPTARLDYVIERQATHVIRGHLGQPIPGNPCSDRVHPHNYRVTFVFVGDPQDTPILTVGDRAARQVGPFIAEHFTDLSVMDFQPTPLALAGWLYEVFVQRFDGELVSVSVQVDGLHSATFGEAPEPVVQSHYGPGYGGAS